MTAEKCYLKETGCIINHRDVKKAMIAFATYHVQKALEAASENSVKMSSTKDTVRNAYDLNNIK